MYYQSTRVERMRSRMMGDYHVRFCERFRGEIPLYLLDVCPALLKDTKLKIKFFEIE